MKLGFGGHTAAIFPSGATATVQQSHHHLKPKRRTGEQRRFARARREAPRECDPTTIFTPNEERSDER